MRVAVATTVVGLLSGCGSHDAETTWKLPNGGLAGTRAAASSKIDADNVANLEARWRFRLTAAPTFSGIFASTPVADAETVYVQDLRSNVYALDRTDGTLRWAHRYQFLNEGPNGLAIDER